MGMPRIRYLFSILKKRIQLLFCFGIYHRRSRLFKSYTKSISASCTEGDADFGLLKNFSLFCKQNYLTEEAISFLERLRQTSREQRVLNYFLLQNYITHNRRLRLKKKDAAYVRAKAASLIQDMLLTSFGDSYANKINACLTKEPDKVKSKIMIRDEGWENLGFIEHQIEGEVKRFLTKIGISLQKNNEIKFYKSISGIYPKMKEVTPAVPGIQISNDSRIFLLIMEKVSGIRPGIDQFQALVDLHLEYIQKCTYKSICNILSADEFSIGHHHLYLCKSFSHIHTRVGFLRIREWISHALSIASYAPEVQQAVRALGDRLNEIRFYEYVVPEKHYSLCHGDYTLSNILYDEGKDAFTIIDWTQCTCGPRLLDIAALLRSQRQFICGYAEIEALVLHKNGTAAAHDAIDKLLFLYASVVVSILLNRKQIIREDPDYFFMPAIFKCHEYIEALLSQSCPTTNPIGFINTSAS